MDFGTFLYSSLPSSWAPFCVQFSQIRSVIFNVYALQDKPKRRRRRRNMPSNIHGINISFQTFEEGIELVRVLLAHEAFCSDTLYKRRLVEARQRLKALHRHVQELVENPGQVPDFDPNGVLLPADTALVTEIRSDALLELSSEASATPTVHGSAFLSHEMVMAELMDLYRSARLLKDFSELNEQSLMRLANFFDGLLPSLALDGRAMKGYVLNELTPVYSFFKRYAVNGVIDEIESIHAQLLRRNGSAGASPLAQKPLVVQIESIHPHELSKRKAIAFLATGIALVLCVIFGVAILNSAREFKFAILEAQLYDPKAVADYTSCLSDIQGLFFQAAGIFTIYGWFFFLNALAWDRALINWPFLFDLNRRKCLTSVELLSCMSVFSAALLFVIDVAINANTYSIWRSIDTSLHDEAINYKLLFSGVENFVFSLFPLNSDVRYSSEETFYQAGDQITILLGLLFVIWAVWPAHCRCCARAAPSSLDAPVCVPPESSAAAAAAPHPSDQHTPIPNEPLTDLENVEFEALAKDTFNIKLENFGYQICNLSVFQMQSRIRFFLSRYRNWLRAQLLRILRTPFYTVTFSDFLVADILVSLDVPLAFIVLTVCNVPYVFSWTRVDVKNNVASSAIVFAISQLVDVQRGLQCARRLFDERQKERRLRENASSHAVDALLREHETYNDDFFHVVNVGERIGSGRASAYVGLEVPPASPPAAQPVSSIVCQAGFFPHGANILKYVDGIPAEAMVFLYQLSVLSPASLGAAVCRVCGSDAFYYAAIGLKVFAYLYKYFWDVTQDCGLLKQFGWLSHRTFVDTRGRVRTRWVRARNRKKLFPHWLYAAEMLFNLVARFSWLPSALSADRTPRAGFALVFVEAFRRFTWCFFRVEYEHLCNCGFFKAIRIQPRAALEVS
eukprot:gnl/Chilomastix_cuspidata/2133.p1 GENE.gnl/Chilomastix_cuspidata/2133~~gnl/Chilomastix_cuspidata/2133.p1  ORF type:complete len:906 (-),score=358.86 gnl/Chilomastix_cuspidata/2133:1119-3836(-)